VEERHCERAVHRVLVRLAAACNQEYPLTELFSRFLFATIISLYNKWMFSPEHFGFPYPLMVTTFHMFVQFALAAFLRFVFPHHFKPDRSPSRRDYGSVGMLCFAQKTPHQL
jgi:hypothetical protein